MASPFSDHTILISGPSFHLDLAALDARHPIHYSSRLLIFQCSSATQREAQLASLKTGLHALVTRCPFLGGTVVDLPEKVAGDGKRDWRTIVPGPGIELVVKDLRASMSSLEELATAHFASSLLPSDMLVPLPRGVSDGRPFPAFKIQFSVVEGGTIITFAMSHSVADGGGMNEITRVLAKQTRLAQNREMASIGQHVPSETTGFDRSVLRNITSEMPFDIKAHPAYRSPKDTSVVVPVSKEPHPFETSSSEIPVLIHISQNRLSLLKTDATLPGMPPISTHDALSALIWRSTMLLRSRRSPSAQALPLSTISDFFMPSDARRHLRLSEPYIGNAVYQLTAALSLESLFSPSGLQQAASAIRRAITAVNPAIVSSLMAMTNDRWIDWGFLESSSTTGVAMGTSWSSGYLYEQDWGAAYGPLVRYRYPGDAFNCVMPKRPDGSAELLLSCLPEEVKLLESVECFGKYFDVD